MAFSGNRLCTSFKKELLYGAHDFDSSTGDTFKIALYDSSATLDETTTAYTSDNEVSGSGYSTGGETLTTVDPASSGTTGYANFANITITAPVTARGALIYNTTPNTTSISLTNPSVLVLDFGRDIDFTAGKTITMPSSAPTTALVSVR